MGNRYHDTPAVRLIDAAVRGTGRPLREAAKEIGIQPNLLSMIRTGGCALPARRCGAFAKALKLDPLALMVACLHSYPDNRSWEAVNLAIGLREA